jgi:hypothetical protein
MARFTSVMLSALMCSLAFTYISPAHAYNDTNSTQSNNNTSMPPVMSHPINTNNTDVYPVQHNATDIPSYGQNQNTTSSSDSHDKCVADGTEHSEEGDHKSEHMSSPYQWEEDEECDEDEQQQDDDCEQTDDDNKQDDNTHTDEQHKKKVDWRDVIEDKYEAPVEEIYTNAKDILHEWGLLSVKSAAANNNGRYGNSRRDQDEDEGDSEDDDDDQRVKSTSNSYDECTVTEFDYSSRSCKAYGMFDDADKYNITQTAYTRTKGLMAISEPMYMSKSELNGRKLGQLGVHFAMCEDYNKKSGAMYRMGLYEKQRATSSSGRTSWGSSSKSENWTLVAKTDVQKFNRRANEYAMMSVDANSTIALKPNTYYTIIMTMAPGNSFTMYTDDADTRPFTSFDFKGTTNNLPNSWNGKKSRNWSAVSMELAMCKSKVKK